MFCYLLRFPQKSERKSKKVLYIDPSPANSNFSVCTNQTHTIPYLFRLCMCITWLRNKYKKTENQNEIISRNPFMQSKKKIVFAFSMVSFNDWSKILSLNLGKKLFLNECLFSGHFALHVYSMLFWINLYIFMSYTAPANVCLFCLH